MRKAGTGCDVTFEDFQDELLVFLARRFGSVALAERIREEMKRRINESDMLSLIGDPKVYLSSYGLSLGVQLIREGLSRSSCNGGQQQ